MATSTPSPSQSYHQLVKSFSSGKELPPLLFLGGEESYYIDRLVELLAEHYLPREEWALSRTILYGSELSLPELRDTILSSSLLGGRRLYIIREVNAIKGLDEIVEAIPSIQPETTVVLCYNGDPERAARSLLKRLTEAQVPLFLSSKMRNSRDTASLIRDAADLLHITVEPDAMGALYDFIGTNGATLYSELRKLAVLASGRGGMVTRAMVEQNVGISREYSPYELLNALVAKQRAKAYKLARYMALNEKRYPLPIILSTLYTYFANLMIVMYQPRNISADDVAKVLGLRNSYAAESYMTGKWAFTPMQVFNIVHEIRMTDARFKGAEGGAYTNDGLLIDLVTFILG